MEIQKKSTEGETKKYIKRKTTLISIPRVFLRLILIQEHMHTKNLVKEKVKTERQRQRKRKTIRNIERNNKEKKGRRRRIWMKEKLTKDDEIIVKSNMKFNDEFHCQITEIVDI